ncbi:Conserved putative Metallocarboxypeptidase D (modular protein) [Capnocytophaga canis]|uniref:Conserved putative Metallocarboxypeptidase D (Modular protein) n=2 Tax=Capnocytophaga canis TaxID=1848903 RepID=A0A0B7I2A3_9FLAO|nr:Conserved putative Metallocarboxypeptidase D (modular protein) [Capnocytophaga canis]
MSLKPATKYIFIAIFLEFYFAFLTLFAFGIRSLDNQLILPIFIAIVTTYWVGYQLGEKFPWERYDSIRILFGIVFQFLLLLTMLLAGWLCLVIVSVFDRTLDTNDVLTAILLLIIGTFIFGGIQTFVIGLWLGYKLNTIEKIGELTFVNNLQMEYTNYKEPKLFGRYITSSMIKPLLEKHTFENKILLGKSVQGNSISLYQKGNGRTKILIWSQMHGNESTTTKALFDVLNYMTQNPSELENISMFFIPILNPDGAEVYNRMNANEIDLNRDAYDLSQPESQCLRKAYKLVQPDFCFNLHDQRTIFSAGKTQNPATVSFLAPSYNGAREINHTRKKAMEVIGVMNAMLQTKIPNQVGRFDDSFNLNCTGDMYTSLGTPTILFESGHYQNDYAREQTRKYISLSILEALAYINQNEVTGKYYKPYFTIPENDKLFFDILIRDDFYGDNNHIGILFKETLKNNEIHFEPYIAMIEDLSNHYGHQERKLSDFFTKPISKKDIEKELNLRDFGFKIA